MSGSGVEGLERTGRRALGDATSLDSLHNPTMVWNSGANYTGGKRNQMIKHAPRPSVLNSSHCPPHTQA